MRKTGSREPRESREASATSPVSIAGKTFSIRFGSRRIQRPSHQKMRSSPTASAVSDTIRIGHMIGPPLRKLSTKKFLSNMPSGAAGLAAGAGLEAGAGLDAGLTTGAALEIGPGGLETGEVPGLVIGFVPVTGGAPATVGAGAAGFVTAVVAAGAGGTAAVCAFAAGGAGGRTGGGAF